MAGRITIDDISRLAGVSTATVSRVLNNSDKVSETTRKKIQTIINKYNYQPSNIARALIKKESRIIGVVIDDLANPFFTEIARGIETVLQANSYTMFLTCSSWNQEKENDIVRQLFRNQIDGLLITPISGKTKAISHLQSENIPAVFMNYRDTHPRQCFVSSDNVLGAQMGTRLFIENGFREVFCLKGFEHQTANDRVEGFCREIEEHHPSRITAKIFSGINQRAEGLTFSRENSAYFRKLKHRCGIFALNDFAAFGIIDGLLECGIPVPEKVAVVGYDDVSFAESYRIPLTTVRQPKFELGQIAAQILLAQLAGRKNPPQQIIMKPRLVIRQSCP